MTFLSSISGISLSLSKAEVIDNQLELTVDVGGFRGDTPVTLMLVPLVGVTTGKLALTGGSVVC